MNSKLLSFLAVAAIMFSLTSSALTQQGVMTRPKPDGCGGSGATYESCFQHNYNMKILRFDSENGSQISTKPLQGKLWQDIPVVDVPIGVSFANNLSTALSGAATLTCPTGATCYAWIEVSNFQLDGLWPPSSTNSFAAYVLFDGGLGNILSVNVVSVEPLCVTGTSCLRDLKWRTATFTGSHTVVPYGFVVDDGGFGGSYSRNVDITLYKVD
ncbi:MAG: hypothetical protein WA172_23530 [Terriglobales bacterium]